MKGLYVKDFHLLVKQKLFFLATIFLTVMNANNLQNLVLVPTFMVFFFLSIIFTTITIDGMNQGFTFLFTLPFSRKKYVIEKYCLSLIGTIIALLLSVVIVVTMNLLQGGSALDMKAFAFILVSLFLIGSLYISLILPFYFKLDEGKSRLIIIIVMAIIFFFVFLGKALFERLGIDIQAILLRVSTTPLWLLFTGGTAVAIVACVLSLVLSFRFIGMKEF